MKKILSTTLALLLVLTTVCSVSLSAPRQLCAMTATMPPCIPAVVTPG